MSASNRVAQLIKIVKDSGLHESFVEGDVFKVPSLAVIQEKMMKLSQFQAIVPKPTDDWVQRCLNNHKYTLRDFYERKLNKKIKFEYELRWKEATYDILSVVRKNEQFWKVIEKDLKHDGARNALYEAISEMPELVQYPDMTAKKIRMAVYPHMKHFKAEIADIKWEKKMEGEVQQEVAIFNQPLARSTPAQPQQAQPLLANPPRRIRVQDLPELDLPTPPRQELQPSQQQPVAHPSARQPLLPPRRIRVQDLPVLDLPTPPRQNETESSSSEESIESEDEVRSKINENSTVKEVKKLRIELEMLKKELQQEKKKNEKRDKEIAELKKKLEKNDEKGAKEVENLTRENQRLRQQNIERQIQVSEETLTSLSSYQGSFSFRNIFSSTSEPPTADEESAEEEPPAEP